MTLGIKNVRRILCGLVVATGGCAANHDLSTIDRPAFPSVWGSLDRASFLGECPDLAGEYQSIPEIVELEPSSNWGEQFSGEDHDYVLLFSPHRVNLERPGAAKEIRLEGPQWDGEFFKIEQEGSDSFTLIVTNSRDPHKAFRVKYIQRLGDYSCLEGEMTFPQYRFEGGTEGGYFNELVDRSLFITISGDIVFYEQKHKGHEQVRHRYYRFSKI